MNILLLVAGALTILVGVVHSILGEILVFSRLRNGTLVPRAGKPLLRERHVRILWASWHLVSIFGFGFAAILLYASNPANASASLDFTIKLISIILFIGSVGVCFATNGKHPGWLGLLVVATLAWLG